MTWRRGLLVALRLLLGLGLLAALVAHQGLGDLVRTLGSVPLHGYGVALGMYLAYTTVGALRPFLLLRAAGHPVPFPRVAALQFASLFVNRFVPGGVVGDAAKMALLRRDAVPFEVSGSAVLVERLVSLIVLLVTAAVAGAVSLRGSAAADVAVLAAVGLVAAGALAALTSDAVAGRILRGLSRVAPRRLAPLAEGTERTLAAFRRRPRVLLSVAAVALVHEAATIGVFWFLARSLGLHVPLVHLAAAVPLFFAAAAVPLTPSGIGVREGVLLWWLSRLGHAGEPLLALPAAWLLVSLAAALLGGFVLVAEGARVRAAAPR